MRGISIRWWLGLAFAFIAALTAVAVAEVFSQRAETSFRNRASELAVGQSVAAAADLADLPPGETLQEGLTRVSESRRLSLFVFSGGGGDLPPARSRSVFRDTVPFVNDAVETVLTGRRFAADVGGGDSSATVVGLRIGPTTGTSTEDPGVLIAYARHDELAEQLGILESRIVEAAVAAFVIAAIVGLFIAAGIAGRLRRISAFAAEIEAGNFDAHQDTGFRDEMGELTDTLNRMRRRLRDSFNRIEGERDRREQLLERLREGVVAVNRRGRIEYANSAAARMLGVERLARGDRLPDPWPSLSLRDFAETLFEQGASVAPVRIQADDQIYSVVGLPEDEGATAVIVLTDVSADERRERAEREFAANAAHELRTPLAAIASAVEVLQMGAKDDPDARDRFLDHIERESARLGRLARVLLVLARAGTNEERPVMETIRIDEVLGQVVAGGSTPAVGVEVEVACEPDLRVLAHPDLAYQIFSNLYSNSVKHTERGMIRLDARRDGEAVVVDVADSGAGISRVDSQRVFDRFFRADPTTGDGFGLGLSIVRQSVEALGGTVVIGPRPEGGTLARVTLPAGDVDGRAQLDGDADGDAEPDGDAGPNGDAGHGEAPGHADDAASAPAEAAGHGGAGPR